MISTITTSTVSTIATAGIAGSVALVGILVLISLLVQKEITSSSSKHRVKQLNRILNIGIPPLLFAFILIVGARVIEVLR